jgi:transcriptional regulator with XRE-family HTH domain
MRMPPRRRAIDDARRSWTRQQYEIGDQLRTARRVNGLTQAGVGVAIGVSTSEVSRRELGRSNRLTGTKLSVHAAAVGLRLSVRLFPIGGAIRDAGQLRYIGAFVARVGRRWRVSLEVPVPQPGDLRAVDVVLRSAGTTVAVEVITRLADVQAQLRAAELKRRDIGADRLVIVVAATRANRAALALARQALAASYDLDTRRVLADLAAGRDPGRDGIVLQPGTSSDGRATQ